MNTILFYISSLNRGGAERVLLKVMNFCKTQYRVVLLTDWYADDEYELPKDIKRICIQDLQKKKLNRYLLAMQRLWKIRCVCKKEYATAAIAFMGSSGIRLEIATMLMKVHTAIAIRNDPTDELKDKKRRYMLLRAMHKTDGVIFQFEGQKAYFDVRIQKKSVVICNPANEAFCNVNYTGKKENKIVTVGRLYDYKNQTLLIEAFDDLKEEFPEFKLYIYGEGEYRSELERLIRELKLRGRVFLPGAVRDVVTAIQDAKLFVLPSDTEGMPNTLMEAMLIGLPVVSTDCPCGGPRTLIEDGKNGILVPVGDRQELVSAMRKVLSDDVFASQIGTRAKKLIDCCNEQVIEKQWLSFLKNIV